MSAAVADVAEVEDWILMVMLCNDVGECVSSYGRKSRRRDSMMCSEN